MEHRLRQHPGISSRRMAALVLAGSTLLLGAEAQATDLVSEADPPARPERKAESDHDKRERDEGIIVTGDRYRINTLNSRLGDVRDAPQSVSIIPRDVIEKQSATTLRDVLRNVSGISFAAGEGGGGPAGDNLTLRGFGARNDIFIDGIRDFGSYSRDTFNVEQVEVVKGPASAQTGRGSTGGYINLFTKQPHVRTFASGTVGAGAPDYLRATGDLNIGENDIGLQGAAARVNLLYHDADTPGRDHVANRRIGFAPAIAVGLGSSTRAIASYMLLDQDNVPDYGIPYVPATNIPLADFADQPAPVDFGNYYGILDRDFEKVRTNILTFAVERDLTDSIRTSNTSRYGHSRRDSIYSAPRFVSTDTTEIRSNPQSRDTVDEILLNQTNIFGEFAIGAIRHDLIAGFEIAREKSRNQLRSIPTGSFTDLFDPDPSRPYDEVIADIPGEVVRAEADTVAAYLFDTVHLSEQFIVSGGLRWERFKTEFQPAPPEPERGRTDETITWRAGLTYKPVPALSLYAGAGTSVNPSIENLTFTTPSEAVVALKPEKSRTYEVGAKWDGMNGMLIVTGALFRIDKVNARTDGLPGEPATVLDGEQRVDGVELGVTGRITPNWQVLGAYTYLDSKVLSSNDPAEQGNRLANVPKHSGSLWSLFDVGRVEFGGGVRHVGTRFTNLSNNRRLDGYWLVEATAAYEFSRKVTLRLNAFNLLDEQFVDATSGGHFIPGPGRQVIATLAFGL